MKDHSCGAHREHCQRITKSKLDFAMSEEGQSEWDKRRYIPKPGEPELPPQLSELANKSSDEVIGELNRLPFFMTKLDETDGGGGENTTLEALKSLAYEGEPHEIAENFKNQGNDCYRAKQYQNAIVYYTKGIDVGCEVDSINATLHVNRAACNMELKNYRRCIEDCKKVLLIDPKNIKASFRTGKSLYHIGRYEEARKVLEYGLQFDQSNKPLKDVLKLVVDKEHQIATAKEQKQKREEQQKMKKTILAGAIKMRDLMIIKSKNPMELLEETSVKLQDEADYQSQLIFPAIVLYPTIDEFDFVAEIGELSTPTEILEVVLDRPSSWFEDPKHKGFTLKNLDCYMETISGGLIKVGKNVAINEALMSTKAKAPLFDNAVRLYVVPKPESKAWLSTWDKQRALSKRNENQ